METDIYDSPQKKERKTDIYDRACTTVLSLKYFIRLNLIITENSVDRKILEDAHEEVESLQGIAKRVREKCESRLVTDIEDASSGLDEAIQSHVSRSGNKFIVDKNLKQGIDHFSERVKRMEAKMKEYDVEYSSRIGSYGGQKPKMFELSDLCRRIAFHVIRGWETKAQVRHVSVAIYGMAGIGKTTLAKEFFDSEFSMLLHVDCRAWVRVGQNPQLDKIVRSILDLLNPDADSDKMLMESGDENISEYWKDSLRGKKCLIVLDDVWDRWLVEKIYHLFSGTYITNSVMLFTTRLEEVAKHDFGSRSLGQILGMPSVDKRDFHSRFFRQFVEMSSVEKHHFGIQFPWEIIKKELLDKRESWNLLREKVFGKESCPFQLERAGQKIAEHCDGLPLTIVTVANLLSKVEKKPEYWNEIAAKKNHQLFKDAYDEISEVLLPSYEHLPKILQMCFLYMGVFPQDYWIPKSKLINMWCTDGFLEQNVENFSKGDAMQWLEMLVSNTVVMTYQSTTNKLPTFGNNKIKTCGLHSSFWHLSAKEADRIKFFHVLYSFDDGLGEGIESQRRLSFHNNILFAIKDVYESVEDNCASTACSLLFCGPYHQYQVPICFGLKFLRQLDAITIRFYEFPMEILQLVQLKYLALTVNGKLPASISELSDLEFLIVDRHMSIKSYRAPLYLPVEIWNMKILQHLQVVGCDLPDPPCGASLESLSKLLNVSPLSCTKRILKAIPKLEKLRIQIELVPDDDKPLSCFDHILCRYLERLKSFKCVIENPKVVLPPNLLSILPSCLKKLSLSGLGYSWEEMSKLSSLRHLEVLKLQNYAFRGPKWEVEGEGFFSLLSLVIEDTDLEEWKFGSQSFYHLNFLSIKHCYKLAMIHGKFELALMKFELVDCNPLFEKQIRKAKFKAGVGEVNSCSSWIDKN